MYMHLPQLCSSQHADEFLMPVTDRYSVDCRQEKKALFIFQTHKLHSWETTTGTCTYHLHPSNGNKRPLSGWNALLDIPKRTQNELCIISGRHYIPSLLAQPCIQGSSMQSYMYFTNPHTSSLPASTSSLLCIHLGRLSWSQTFKTLHLTVLSRACGL